MDDCLNCTMKIVPCTKKVRAEKLETFVG